MKEGQPAPDVELPAANIATVLPGSPPTLKLSDLKGKNVVLWFFPRAMTPGCTKEACGFRDRLEQFKQLDTVIVGISTDNVAKQEKFTAKEELNFPLFADAEHKIAAAFGVLGDGKKSATRSTFIIGKDGKFVKIYNTVKKAADHPQEVLEFLKKA
jgi:thioredoxin-dependent peroxiredoxin